MAIWRCRDKTNRFVGLFQLAEANCIKKAEMSGLEMQRRALPRKDNGCAQMSTRVCALGARQGRYSGYHSARICTGFFNGESIEKEVRTMNKKQKRIAEAQRRYREAHREEIAEGKRELRDARIAMGLTQREAAELLGVDQSTVCRWETIKPPPNWRTMIEKMKESA